MLLPIPYRNGAFLIIFKWTLQSKNYDNSKQSKRLNEPKYFLYWFKKACWIVDKNEDTTFANYYALERFVYTLDNIEHCWWSIQPRRVITYMPYDRWKQYSNITYDVVSHFLTLLLLSSHITQWNIKNVGR